MEFVKYMLFGFFVSKIEQVVWYTIPPGLVYQHPMVKRTKMILEVSGTKLLKYLC